MHIFVIIILFHNVIYLQIYMCLLSLNPQILCFRIAIYLEESADATFWYLLNWELYTKVALWYMFPDATYKPKNANVVKYHLKLLP